MSLAEHPARSAAEIPPHTAIVDCDVHVQMPGIHALFPYLSDYWKDAILNWMPHASNQAADIRADWFAKPLRVNYPFDLPTSALEGTLPNTAASTEAALGILREKLLDAWATEIAILNDAYFVDQFHNPYMADALASAANDWLVAEWLEREPRLRGSLLVQASQPDLAVAEIERLGDHPSIVQVLLPVRSAVPYGNRRHHPILEAAVRHGLAVGLHFGGWPGTPTTSVGWTSYYIEDYAGRAHSFQAQLLSLVTEGVFDRMPDLRVVFVESGFAWLPPLMWRFDKDWKGMRRETPWLRRPPSSYVRDHFKFTLQPFDGPDDPGFMGRFADQMGADDMVLFSTDHPHWQFDTPAEALPPGVDGETLTGILSETARRFYRLEGGSGH